MHACMYVHNMLTTNKPAHMHAHTHTHTCLLAETGNRKLPIAAEARMRMVSFQLDSNCRGRLHTQSQPIGAQEQQLL